MCLQLYAIQEKANRTFYVVLQLSGSAHGDLERNRVIQLVLQPGLWKRKLEAEAVLFLWKRKRENPTASAST